jgi:hypothetical protein
MEVLSYRSRPGTRVIKTTDPFFEGEIVIKRDVIKGEIIFEKPSIDWLGKIYNTQKCGENYILRVVIDIDPGTYKLIGNDDYRKLKLRSMENVKKVFEEELKDDIQEKAIAALEHAFDDIEDDYEPECVRDALDCFDWEKTEDGYDFWLKVYEECE